MSDTQAQEAARLAEWHRDQALQWRRAAAFEAADNQEPTRSMLTRTADMHVDAAALLRSQAARIAELERELARMREPLTRQQINSASRDAQISFCLKSGGTYEEELARAIEAAHGITQKGGA